MNLKPLTEEEIKELNNRFTYHPPKGDQAERYTAIRDKAKELATLIMQACPTSQQRSLALSQIQFASMAANQAIACNE